MPAASGVPLFTSENGIAKMYVVVVTASKTETATRKAAAKTLCALSTMTGNKGCAVLAVRKGEITGPCSFLCVDEVYVVAVKEIVRLLRLENSLRLDVRLLMLGSDKVRTARCFAVYAHSFLLVYIMLHLLHQIVQLLDSN